MQFEPPTFREYGVRADRSAKLSPYNPKDAIFSTARMLCADGAAKGTATGLKGAIYAYNHAHWYVRAVLAIAARYTAAAQALPQPRPRHLTRKHRAAPRPGPPIGAVRGGGGVGRVRLMALIQRNVLILAADDFEDMELLYPLHRLIEEGVAVTVAGLDDHPVRGKKGYGPLPVDTTVDQVAEPSFDALVIPGGYAPDKLRRSDVVLDLVRAFDTAGKPIAFICHAGWVPISAKIIKGRRATSVGAIRDDMVNAGADWVDEAAVVDGNLISARTPDDLGPWMKALLAALAG